MSPDRYRKGPSAEAIGGHSGSDEFDNEESDPGWEKVGAQWRSRWVPLGQGMVPLDAFFEILAQIPFPGPISLHIEYDPGGVTKVQKFENSLAAAARDLEFHRGHLKTAYQQP